MSWNGNSVRKVLSLGELRKHDPDLDVSSMAELRRRL
jgi:hypothetical protein